MRIEPKTIAAIRDAADIVAIISRNVELAPKGRSHVGACPFCLGETPCFNVNVEKGFFYCFGCKEKGTIFDFLMKMHNVSFPEACALALCRMDTSEEKRAAGER